ncbi:sensor histidine kinase [Amycolatopsis vastitatis]|uniref:sensor histidine kinase n=1 Tax=Amycolatopsis vastitatis TaxID=1905142 RepID=UPI0013044465|nr:histidine kinase [Amycolatopsis vastitatis]
MVPPAPGATADGLPGGGFPARLIFVVHSALCLGIGVLRVLEPLREARSWLSAFAACGYAAALVAVHLAGFCYGPARFRVPALAAQALLGVLPVLQLGAAWSPLGCFFAGSVLLAARPVVSVPVLALVSAGAGLLVAGVGTPVVSVVDGVDGALLTAVGAGAVFGLAWFSGLAARYEVGARKLTSRAIAEERLRFSQDTHDLLGLSLSAITLKIELIRRLVDTEPDRAKTELAELVTISRKALADVRSIAAGSRRFSLAEERRAAAAVLETAGVSVHIGHRLPAHLPEPVATMFATMLREGATNVVRHSKATWCELTVGVTRGEAWLRITNDGVVPGEEPDDDEEHGAGLRNLEDRVGALGGTLTVGPGPDGTHVLRAAVPLQPFLPPRRGARLVPKRLRAIRLRWRSGWRARGSGR